MVAHKHGLHLLDATMFTLPIGFKSFQQRKVQSTCFWTFTAGGPKLELHCQKMARQYP